MDFSFLHNDLGYLLWGTFPDGPPGGALLTLILAASGALLSALLGLVFGIALAMGRGPSVAVLRTVLGFLRAIPVLMLIFWTYFLLPVLFGVAVPGAVSVVAALALVSGAYLAHAVAAGIEAVGTAQWQAALAMGFTRWGALRYVVLPQALRIMLPSFINQWVTLVKDSSLAYIVGVPELSFLATQVNAQLMVRPAEVFLVVGALYWLICSLLDWGANAVVRAHARRAAA